MPSEKMDIIDEILANKDYCPCLLLGRYSTEFKRRYKGRVHMVNTLSLVRELLNSYSGMPVERYFVMDGIGFLSPTGCNSVLKFIEEFKSPIILLSYYDKILPTIRSRMKFVFKSPVTEVKSLDYMSMKNCLEDLKEERDLSDMDRLKAYSDKCPILYYVEKVGASYDPIGKRINKIICS